MIKPSFSNHQGAHFYEKPHKKNSLALLSLLFLVTSDCNKASDNEAAEQTDSKTISAASDSTSEATESPPGLTPTASSPDLSSPDSPVGVKHPILDPHKKTFPELPLGLTTAL